MPEVKVGLSGLTSDEATTAPKRIPVPEGDYIAVIMSAPLSTTNHKPVPLQKMTVEFQLLHATDADGKVDEEHAGRRVWQDYVMEPDPKYPHLAAQRIYELRMLLDATAIEYSDEGFDSDDMCNKTVKITVRHRDGKDKDDDGNYPKFANVVGVDTAEEVPDDDLV